MVSVRVGLGLVGSGRVGSVRVGLDLVGLDFKFVRFIVLNIFRNALLPLSFYTPNNFSLRSPSNCRDSTLRLKKFVLQILKY